MKKLAVTLFLFFICFTSHAQRWTLVYQNDAQGDRVTGSIDNLVNAVREGLPIRVGWKSQSAADSKRKVEHLAEAKFLTIMSDKVVFAQIDPIIGQTPDFEKQFI
jgi:hypothetical protein